MVTARRVEGSQPSAPPLSCHSVTRPVCLSCSRVDTSLWVQPMAPAHRQRLPTACFSLSPPPPPHVVSLPLSLGLWRWACLLSLCPSTTLPVSVPSGLRLWDPEHSTEPGCREGLRLLLSVPAALPRSCCHVSWEQGWVGLGGEGKGTARRRLCVWAWPPAQPGNPGRAVYPQSLCFLTWDMGVILVSV